MTVVKQTLTTISGWGNYPTQEAQVITPLSTAAYKEQLAQYPSVIARGMGRSYGDSANAPVVLQTTYCDHFIAFDKATGLLTVEAGVLLRDVLIVTFKQ
jgi:FAD/FMN-containing dehydrogenase